MLFKRNQERKQKAEPGQTDRIGALAAGLIGPLENIALALTEFADGEDRDGEVFQRQAAALSSVAAAIEKGEGVAEALVTLRSIIGGIQASAKQQPARASSLRQMGAALAKAAEGARQAIPALQALKERTNR